MVRSVNSSGNSAPVNPAPSGKIDLSASIAKNFTKSIINSAKAVAGGSGFKLTIAAKVSHKA